MAIPLTVAWELVRLHLQSSSAPYSKPWKPVSGDGKSHSTNFCDRSIIMQTAVVVFQVQGYTQLHFPYLEHQKWSTRSAHDTYSTCGFLVRRVILASLLHSNRYLSRCCWRLHYWNNHKTFTTHTSKMWLTDAQSELHNLEWINIWLAKGACRNRCRTHHLWWFVHDPWSNAILWWSFIGSWKCTFLCIPYSTSHFNS